MQRLVGKSLTHITCLQLIAIEVYTYMFSTGSGLVHHHEPGIVHEICMRETLNASCGGGSGLDRRPQVIVIRSARYGRMRIGRCVRKGYDYLGCAVDVRAYMDTRCSGRHSCTMRVPDDVIFEMQPCPTDLTSYLDISYDCIDGVYTHAHYISCKMWRLESDSKPNNLIWIILFVYKT